MAGRRVRCKQCGVTFQLPNEPTSDEPFQPHFVDEHDHSQGQRTGSLLDDAHGPPEENAFQPAPIPVRPTPEIQPPFGDEPFDPNAVEADSVFESAFQDFYPSRGNTPFVFPGSRGLDRWLPTVVVIGCLGWLAYLTLVPGEAHEPQWVGTVRLLILMMAYTGVVFPISLKGIRIAARKLNYELPSHAPWRAFGTFLLPVTIGCAVWLSSGSVPGFILGAVLGLVVALPIMWLLFRIRGDDLPMTFGHGSAGYGIGLVAAILLLSLLNLIVAGAVRASKAQHTLAISPFGPGFSWDGPTIVEKPEKKSAVAKAPPSNVPVTPTTKAFSEAKEKPATQPLPSVATSQPAPPPPQTVQTQPIPPDVAQQPAHGEIVASATVRITGETEPYVYPLLGGRAVAVVRASSRANEDRIELWSIADWTPLHEKSFARSALRADYFHLSPDGNLLARLTEFPVLGVQVYAFKEDELLRPSIRLDPAGAAPSIAGFIGPDQLLTFLINGPKSAAEVWDVRSAKRVRHLDVPGLRAQPGSFAVSRDGKQLAAIIREDASGPLLNGRLDVYNFSTQKLSRRIIIDELQWNPNVKPSGLAFNEEGDKLAALFEHQGQGLFLSWGPNSDIPEHQHLYPGGLVPENVNVGAFRGSSFALVEQGRSWLYYGASLFDTASGRELGRLGIERVISQKEISPSTVLLVQDGPTQGKSTLLEVKLDFARARRTTAGAKP
jgi:hypothetical protein